MDKTQNDLDNIPAKEWAEKEYQEGDEPTLKTFRGMKAFKAGMVYERVVQTYKQEELHFTNGYLTQAKEDLECELSQLEYCASESNKEISLLNWKVEQLEKINANYASALKWIAKDMAALEQDCAHEQADMYVARAQEALDDAK